MFFGLHRLIFGGPIHGHVALTKINGLLDKKILETTNQRRCLLFSYGKGFLIFLFQSTKDKDLIFKSDPYSFGTRGLYLNKWSLYFHPADDIPSMVLVWVKLLHLPLPCCYDGCLRSIGNTLGKYIDKLEPKGKKFVYARIYIEVDLEKGLLSEIILTNESWSHFQTLHYGQLPFK